MTTVNTRADDAAWQGYDAPAPTTEADAATHDGAQSPSSVMHDASDAAPVKELSAASTPPALPPSLATRTSLGDTASTAAPMAFADSVSAPSVSLAWIAAVAVPLLLIAACGAAVFIVSRLGWRRFAQRYPVWRPAPGRSFVATLVRFSSPLRSYRDSVRVTLGEQGLHFSAVRKHRWSQPDFIVPWTSVAAVLRRHATGSLRYRIVIDDAAGSIMVRLRGDVSDIVHAYWKLGDASKILDREDRDRPTAQAQLEPELRADAPRPARLRRTGRAVRRRPLRVL